MLAGCDVATTDAGQNACDTLFEVGAPDGSLNTCGACAEATVLVPGQAGSATWGLYVFYGFETVLGDTTPADLNYLNLGYDLGACILAESSSAAACGLDVMGQEACIAAVCLPLCILPENYTQDDITNFQNCEDTAAVGACSAYTTAANSDCGSGAALTAYNTCNALVNQDGFVNDAAPPTSSSEEQLINLVCGGT